MNLKIKYLLNTKNILHRNYRTSIMLKRELIQNRLTYGKVLERDNLKRVDTFIDNINLSEFKIFSQWGDDGIINFLINYIDIENDSFIEFGVENYTECNTRFLLINNNWKGLIIDGSKKNIDSVKRDTIYWQHDLTAIYQFITPENINSLIINNGFEGKIGLLNIDIDGIDYWVWEAITSIEPTIVVVEYNSLFGFENAWTVPKNSQFYRGTAHYSNLYYGVSLLSLCDLADEKGYSFIGCNSNGNNAYFVKNEKLKSLKVLSPEQGFYLSKFSESRNEKGDLTFLRGKDRINLLKGMDIFNTRTNSIEKI